MQIKHLIFLIHPCCYEGADPELIRRNNWSLFLDRELEVKQHWLEAVRGQSAGTLLMQLYCPPERVATTQESLGVPNDWSWEERRRGLMGG